MARAMKVAIVDDEADMRQSISQWLALSGFDTETYASAEEALKGIGPEFPGVVVSDIKMPGMDGLEFLRRMIAIDPAITPILMTGYGTIEMAVGTLGGLLPLHKSGKLQIVGVATAKRLSMAPDILTVAESGGLSSPFEAMLWNVVAVPRNTPPEVRKALADATKQVMTSAAMNSSLDTQGMFADLHIGDVEAAAYVKSEAAKWKPVIDNLGAALKN